MSFSMSVGTRKRQRPLVTPAAFASGSAGDHADDGRSGDAQGDGDSDGDEQEAAAADRLAVSAVSLAEAGQFQDALAEWRKALLVQPSRGAWWEMRAQCESELGMRFEAVQVRACALAGVAGGGGRVCGGGTTPGHAVGRALTRRVRVQSAERAVAERPQWVPALVTLARAQLNFGELEMAVQTFGKVCGRAEEGVEWL